MTFLRKLLVASMERGHQNVALYAVEELLGFCWSEQEVESAFQQIRDVEADLAAQRSSYYLALLGAQ